MSVLPSVLHFLCLMSPFSNDNLELIPGAVSGPLHRLSYPSCQQPVFHRPPWLPLCLAFKRLISPGTERFSLLMGPLLPLLYCRRWPLHASCPSSVPFYYCRGSWRCTAGTKEHACLDDSSVTPRCFWYSLWNISLDWPDKFFYQIHSIDLKITILSSSSALLFDPLWQQDEVI